MYLYDLVAIYILFVKTGCERGVLPILSRQPGARSIGPRCEYSGFAGFSQASRVRPNTMPSRKNATGATAA